ncbi:MAG: hypothetical protein GC160_14475 [Acidobacteria bacterium]|nr:hypothetical protein [Acidobacteriota bacterium]
MRLLFLVTFVCAVGAAQEAPRTMKRLSVWLQSPDVPKDSFAAQPKRMFRAGNKYCRTEEAPDTENGIHGLLIANEPDVWMVNRLDETAKHIVDPGPTFNCRMPILGSHIRSQEDFEKPLLQLEFGRELAFFKAVGAEQSEGPLLTGDPTIAHSARVDDVDLILLTTAELIPRAVVAISNGARRGLLVHRVLRGSFRS